MNPLTLHLASGLSLYTGAAMLALVALAMDRLGNRWLARLRNLLAWVAAALIGLSTTPTWWPVYGVLGLAFAWWFLTKNVRRVAARTPVLMFPISAWSLVLALILIAVTEIPWTLAPTVHAAGARTLYVLGDSMSSGLGKDTPWPALLAARGVNVVNLSRPGITAADGPDIARKITNPDSVTLIELGGNDLLGDTGPAAFRDGLRATLTLARARSRAVVMMELPLRPGDYGYGYAQRALAREFDVPLIPKRLFVRALSADDSLDGLHLGPAGARRMADTVWSVVAPGMSPPK